VDNPVCVACGRGLSLEEIERGAFKHLAGRLYCAGCVEAMRTSRPPVQCPNCGAIERPLEVGGKVLCGECGAELRERPRPTPREAKPPARPTRAAKRCPYCGAVLPAEALRCRYCGSPLTREARDLAVSAQQNSRLRFWLGCLLSACVFLFAFLLYVVATRPAGHTSGRQPTPSGPAGQEELVRQLREELASVRRELSSLRARPTPEKVSTAPPPRPPAPRRPQPPTPRPATRLAARPEPTPPRRPERPSSKTVAVRPRPKTSAKPTPQPPPKPKGPSPAELAQKAYGRFKAQFERLRGARKFDEAVALARRFVAAYLGTPAAKKAQADQQGLRQEIERIRDDRAGRFRKALDAGDLDAAKRVVAELKLYEAPEIRRDVQQMLAAIEAAEQEPARRMAMYLDQWETPPHVARLLKQLKSEKDWTRRSQAIQELARIGHRSALRGLIEALRDPEWYVRVRAMDALAEIGDPIALSYLVPLTKSSFPVIYDPAARAVRSLAGAPREKYAEAWRLVDPAKVSERLSEALRLPGKEVSAVTTRYQVALIESLALLGEKSSAKTLEPLTKSNDPVVSKAAALAIEKLTGQAPSSPEAAKPGPAAPATSPEPNTEPRTTPDATKKASVPEPAATAPERRASAPADHRNPAAAPAVEPTQAPRRSPSVARPRATGLAAPVEGPTNKPPSGGLVPAPGALPPPVAPGEANAPTQPSNETGGLTPAVVPPQRAASAPKLERTAGEAKVAAPIPAGGQAEVRRSQPQVGGPPLAFAAEDTKARQGPGLELVVQEKVKVAKKAAQPSAEAPKATGAPPRATGGPGHVPPPGDEPSGRRAAIVGKAEQPTDEGLLRVGVREGHGLKVGDVVEVLVDGKAAFVGKVAEAEAFRVVLRLSGDQEAGRIQKSEVVIRLRE